jgi:putative flippase GtrA
MKGKRIRMFLKFQLSAIVATLVDFGVTIFLKEALQWDYLVSTSIGSVVGGLFNFAIGRRWVFKVADFSRGKQASRYLLTWFGSILLNIGIVFVLTEFLALNYVISKVISAITVSTTFNYSLQKRFVFSFNDPRQAVTK